jgi:hypothetical protein
MKKEEDGKFYMARNETYCENFCELIDTYRLTCKRINLIGNSGVMIIFVITRIILKVTLCR